MYISAMQPFLDLNRAVNMVVVVLWWCFFFFVGVFCFVLFFSIPEMGGFVSGRQYYLICYLSDFISKILKSWIAKKLLLGESLEKTPVIGN